MNVNYNINTDGYLDITFGPKWDYISVTRLYVESFMVVNMNNTKNIHKIGTAASELLENATKYSSKDGIRMIIQKSKSSENIILRVFNHATSKQSDKVSAIIAEMNHQTPLEYYINKMKESVKNRGESAGLGLARIRSEGGAQLTTAYNDTESLLEVQAKFKISNEIR